MNNYINGKFIKELREKQNLTQQALANIIMVSNKTISKWETGKGYPDISLIEPLSKALKVSIIELMNNKNIENKNISSNMLKSIFYVCPICHNIIHTTGESTISCCGLTLLPQSGEPSDQFHEINCELVENEYYISLKHPMTKKHFISFIAYLTNDRLELIKLYPEQNPEVRFLKRGHGIIYIYCNQDGLYKKII